MNLITKQIVFNASFFENLNETKKDPTNILPQELVLEIFSHLNLATLGTICRVSKTWKLLASEPRLWKMAIYKEIAFGNDKWAQCFGADIVKNEDNSEEFSSLPSDDFIADCKKFKKIFPKKNVKDSLMLVRLPKTLNGGLTLKSLGELAKKYFSATDAGYRSVHPDIIQEQGDKSIDKSQWVLMTKNILPGSGNKSYSEQETIVHDLAKISLTGYEVPKTLEAATCIFSQYFGSNIRLFGNDPCTFTRCQEDIQGFQLVLGAFSQGSLIIDFDYFDDESFGIAALRKF